MSESERIFDRETILDLTVNVIPLGIILFFVVVFLITSYWEFDPFTMAVSMGLLVVPFVLLALLTFVSGRAVSKAEKAETSAAAIDESFEETPALESNETEASADMTAGVTDDEAAALAADEGDTSGDETDASDADESDEDGSETDTGDDSEPDDGDADEGN